MRFAALILLVLATVALAQSPDQNQDAVLTLNESKILAVQGITSVSNQIFRGPRLTPDEVQSLAGAGIKYIVNLQGGDLETPRWLGMLKRVIRHTEPGELQSVRDIEANAALNDNKIGYVNIPLDSLDPVSETESAKVRQVLLLVRTLTLQGLPLYIHCEHGRDRTGMIVALYRIRYEGWTVDHAYSEWKTMGHSGFWDNYFTGYLDPFYQSVATGLHDEYQRENPMLAPVP